MQTQMYEAYSIIDQRVAYIHENFAIAKQHIHSCEHYPFAFLLTNSQDPVITSCAKL